MKKIACLLSLTFMVFAFNGAFAQVLFNDPFDGAQGTAPNNTNWRLMSTQGTEGQPGNTLLDGSGNLVMDGCVDNWNGPAIELQPASGGQFTPDGSKAYTVEYRVQAPSPQTLYIGLTGTGGLGAYRAFMLTGPSFPENPLGINVNTSQGGTGGGYGTATDVLSYPAGSIFGLAMVFQTDGTLEYWYDDGGASGYDQMTVGGSVPAETALLNTCSNDGSVTYAVKVDANGWNATGAKGLIIDRITIYEGIPGFVPVELSQFLVE